MAYKNVNRQNLLAVRLCQLRRHFNGCKQCRGARSARDFDRLCDDAKVTLLEIAIKWDNNIAGRLAARNGGHDYIYPCPDTNAHGPAYALTAEACIINSVQDRIM